MGLLPRALPVTGGAILLAGRGHRRARPSERLRELRATRMSMIFQEPMTALNPVMRCGDADRRGAARCTPSFAPQRATREDPRDRARSALPDPERMVASYPHQLSGGQRQRIMIAMALVLEPGAADRRRADHRARRHHAGADPRADPRPAGASTAPACCSSRTTSASSPRSPTASRCCGWASWSSSARRDEVLQRAAARLHADADRRGAELQPQQRAADAARAAGAATRRSSPRSTSSGGWLGRGARCAPRRT